MPETRRDVSWAIKFRMERTGAWVEWSNGHRTPGEAVAHAEVLAAIPSIADIRFERITHQRELFTLHELPGDER